MKSAVCVVPFIMLVAVAACTTTAPAGSEPGQAVQASTTSPIQPPRMYQLHKGEKIPVRLDADFCFNVFGSCSFSFCDGDWNDTQELSEVCCNNGSCGVEYYSICGGPCEPETSSCSC